MIWQRQSRLRPLAGAVWLGVAIVAFSIGQSASPISGSGTITFGGHSVTSLGLAQHKGGIGRGRSVFEGGRRRAHDVTILHAVLARSDDRSTIGHGRIVLPLEIDAAVDVSRDRFARGKGTVDDRPIIDEEAFILGLLLGEDE